MSSAEVVRSMKIKTSTLKRIHKEYVYYQKETEKEQTRVENMKQAAGADAHDLRQAVSAGHCMLAKPSSSSTSILPAAHQSWSYKIWQLKYFVLACLLVSRVASLQEISVCLHVALSHDLTHHAPLCRKLCWRSLR
jgi:hypothetical protein